VNLKAGKIHGLKSHDYHIIIFDLFSLFDSIRDAHFFCLLSFSSWYDNSFDGKCHKR
jgi:hypothetical protein